jgi:hypothetical protein
MDRLTFGIQPICEGCEHFYVDESEPISLDDNVNPQSPNCLSFPKGIPIKIWINADPHLEPIGGEVKVNGEPLIFEPVDDLDILEPVLRTRKNQIRAENEWIEANAID